MAYRYKKITKLSETYPNEQICAVHKNPKGNFTATVLDERLEAALKDDNYKLVVWRYDEDPSWYEGIDKDGRLREMRYEDYKVEDMVFLNKEDLTEEEKKEFLDTCPEGKDTPKKIEDLHVILDAIDNGEIKVNQYGEINKNSGVAYGKKHGNVIYLSEMRYSTNKSLYIKVDGREEEVDTVWRIENLIKNLQNINRRFEGIVTLYKNREMQYKKKHEKEIYEEANRERIIANRIAYAWLGSLRLEIPTEVKEERDYWRNEQCIPEFVAETKSFRGYDFIRRSDYGEFLFYGNVVSKEDADYISKVIERTTWDLLPMMNKCWAAIEDVMEKYKKGE